MKKPIYLSGFMGSGKSYIAKNSGLNFTDLDKYIEKQQGLTIPEIFAEHGEIYFRNLELAALKEIKSDLVSLGGGALTFPETADFARKNAVVIFINTPFETCYERIKNDKSRPLAVNKTKEELHELYNSRIRHYTETADYISANENEVEGIINAYLQR
jgi:shikimate kinase